MPGKERELRRARLAAKQLGAFSRAQARQLGYSDTEIKRRRRNGEWITLERGVYADAGSPNTWERRASAKLLEAGPGAALSCWAAAYCLGLIETKPERIDVIVTGRRGPRGSRRADVLDKRAVNGLPVTTVPRTLADLAGVASDTRLEALLDNALVKGLTSIAAVRRYISERGLGKRRGVGKLLRLLDDREKGVPASELERVLERLLRSEKVLMPERQKEIGKYRVDYAYPDKRIYIELDGRAWHTRKAEMDRDNRRRNELVLAGWSVPLYFTWEDLAERPDYVLTTVRTALS